LLVATAGSIEAWHSTITIVIHCY